MSIVPHHTLTYWRLRDSIATLGALLLSRRVSLPSDLHGIMIYVQLSLPYTFYFVIISMCYLSMALANVDAS